MNSLFVAKDNLQKSVLLIVFKINCSPLGLLSDFLGHKGRVQCGLIGREIALVLKFQSGHLENKEENSNILGVTMHL